MLATLLLFLGVVWSTTGSVIISGGGQNYCDGMICPINTGCSVQSNGVNGVMITRRRCMNATGHVVKEEITEGSQNIGIGSMVFNDGAKMCIISHNLADGKVNTTKVCRDPNGEFRPMTPEEEQQMEERRAQAEAEGRRAAEMGREMGRRMYEQGMKQMQQGLDLANRMTAQAREMTSKIMQETARRVNEQTQQHADRMAAHAARMAEHAQRMEEKSREREARLEARAREREARQEALERQLEAKETRESLMEDMDFDVPNLIDDSDW